VDGLPTGAVRCSLGWCSTRADADAAVHFLGSTFCNDGLAPALDDALAAALANAAPTRSTRLPPAAAAVSAGSSTGVVPLLQAALDVSPPTLPPLSPSPPLVLQELWVYPVKSCAGLRVKQWPVALHATARTTHAHTTHADATTSALPSSSSNSSNLGAASLRACLLLDRAFVVVDARSRLPLRARQHPKLAHCFPTVDLAAGAVKESRRSRSAYTPWPLRPLTCAYTTLS
jgi:hypothetical protein